LGNELVAAIIDDGGDTEPSISDRMREESLNIIGARLDPLFYTTSGDPDIWKLSLEAK